MAFLDWFKKHRLLYVSLAAATVYFALEPLLRTLYYDFSPASFIVLHSVMEAVSIIIAFMCFGVTFHSHRLSKNSQSLFLGVAFLAIGVIDVFHTLSYKGMPDFVTPNTVNKATQLWITARLVGASAFLAAAFIRPDREARLLRPYPLLAAGIAVPVAVFFSVVLYPGQLPAMFVEDLGLTPLKVRLEYVISAAQALTAALFFRMYRKTHEDHLIYFIAAMVFGIFSEMFFTLYASPYDIYNLMGHVYKVVSYLFIYQMLYVTSVTAPYAALENAKAVLREYSGHLEETVLERTKELTAQNRELVRLGRLKDDFLAVCSHDMRTPLQSSILLLELLLDGEEGDLTPDQKQSLEAIKKNEFDQLELVTNILGLAIKEQGGMKLELADTDVSGMLEKWAEKQRVITAKKNITLDVDSGRSEDGIRWPLDEFKIRQALSNLMSNALKFTPSGGEIRVATDVDGPDGSLRISVFNSGPAIPEAELSRIFERFHASPAGGRGEHGIGLGLSIARANVELHGGSIRAESEQGRGNTFTLTIPKGDIL